MTSCPPHTAPNIPVDEFSLHTHKWQRRSWNDPHRFRSHRWHRRSRKTTLGLNKLIYAAGSTKEKLFAYIGPTYKQSKKIVVQDPMMLPRYLPASYLAKPFNETELIATFKTGSKLFILGADDPDTIRGLNPYGVVLDEWALQKRSILDEILLPILRENGGWCDFYWTPKGNNHAWQLHQRGGKEAFPDWSRSDLTVEQSGLLTPDALTQARKEMGDDLYRQEMCCEILDTAETVFKGWDVCIAGTLQEPEEGRRYVTGIDLGRSHDATVIITGDVLRRHVVDYQRLTDTHWALQKQAIAMVAARYDSLCFVDATGIGSPIVEDLRDLGLSVEGVTFTPTSKRDLVDGLRIAISQRLITYPNIPQLIAELQDFELSLSPSGHVTYAARDEEGCFDDSVMALALMVRGLKSDLYVPRFSVDLDAQYDAALEEIPANGGISFR